MLAALVGSGLSAAAGLNAYIPFLLVALTARFTAVLPLSEQYAWIESWPAITVATVLLLAEFGLDKVPGVDHVNDAISTAIRPTVGGLIFAATAAAEQAEKSSTFFQENPWVGAVGGAVIALVFHGGKVAGRATLNAATFGTAAPVLSTVEDTASVTLSLAAIFAPILVLVVLVLFLYIVYRIVRRARRRKDRAGGPAPAY